MKRRREKTLTFMRDAASAHFARQIRDARPKRPNWSGARKKQPKIVKRLRYLVKTMLTLVLLSPAVGCVEDAKMVPWKDRKNIGGPTNPPAQGWCGDLKGPPSLRCIRVPTDIRPIP